MTCETLYSIQYFFISEPLIDTPRQGSFYLKHALLAPVCQSPAVASFLSLPTRRTRSLLVMNGADYGCFGCCRRVFGVRGRGCILWCGVRSKLGVAPCGSCVVHICGCGAWVRGVGVDPAPGGMVARGVGNLYTWRSRRGVRESMKGTKGQG